MVLCPNSIEVLKELATFGTVDADHFTGRGGKWIRSAVRAGYAEWVRGRAPYSFSATELRITQAGRDYLAHGQPPPK